MFWAVSGPSNQKLKPSSTWPLVQDFLDEVFWRTIRSNQGLWQNIFAAREKVIVIGDVHPQLRDMEGGMCL